MQPAPKDPPRLLASGSIEEENLQLHCYLDSEPFFVEEDPLKAMLLFIAGYYLGDVKYHTNSRLAVLLLFCTTVGPGKVKRDIVRNPKFIDLLKELKVL